MLSSLSYETLAINLVIKSVYFFTFNYIFIETDCFYRRSIFRRHWRHLFGHAFTRLFILSLIYWLINALIHSLTRPHSLTHSHTHTLTHSLNQMMTNSSCIHSFLRIRSCSFDRSFIYSFIHSFIHSLISWSLFTVLSVTSGKINPLKPIWQSSIFALFWAHRYMFKFCNKVQWRLCLKYLDVYSS